MIALTRKLQPQQATLGATIAIFALLLVGAGIRYTGFLSPGVMINLVSDNAFLGVTAVGMTFVILSGGIDLSVGSVIGFTSILLSVLVERQGWHPSVAIAFALAVGTLLGTLMGAIIQFFELAPFLVTLAGMFLVRGLGFLISVESIQLTHPIFAQAASFRIPLGGGNSLPVIGALFLAWLALGWLLATYTSWGRGVYALGGSEQSAKLMGLPVARTRVLIYSFSGFCAALGGILYAFYTSSGNASAASGLELDAIAAVVIGGTLLTGGSGYVFGTLIGVLILGTIQTAISFEDGLSSWWTKITIGALLFLFIVLQRVSQKRLKPGAH